MNNVANFFWHGNLTSYELTCISSFVDYGFVVNVWSYQDLKIPKGANLKDAREILPVEQLTAYTQNKQPQNLAAFSDVFRFTMLNKVGGWWFDTDCVCLRSVDDFIELTKDRRVIGGKEDEQYVACGAIYFNNSDTSKIFLDELHKRCAESNNKFKGWGWIGPKMFTEVVKQNNLFEEMCSPNTFYPISWREYQIMFQPELIENVFKKCDGAYTCHLWNELFKRDGIDKTATPPANSWLDYIFQKHSKNII
jgi:hypothetical protein